MDVFGPVTATGFAQTETGGPVTYLSPEDHVAARDGHDLQRLASCGRETVLARVEIMGDDGALLECGAEGEVVVRSSHLMEGYYRRAENGSDEGKRIGGWHRTGDVGKKDPDGFVYIVDRKRDMIISRGYNVFPTEVEKVLEAQPGVLGCAVVGVPDDTMGEVVKAVIEVEAGSRIDPKALRKVCRERLAAPKVPVSIEIWPRLPRNSAGKVLRRQVRRVFWHGRERKI
jgi:acyl-CoA synthetase (AMP-forming)/AMP-acid ligase II